MAHGKNLFKNTLILSICTIVNKGLLFLMIPLFSRWLSVEEYGFYDVFATYVSLLIPIITLASSNAVFRLSVDKEDNKEKKFYISNGFYIVLFNSVIAVSGICIFSCYKGWVFFCPFVFMMLGEVWDNYFQGYLRAIKKLSVYGICKTVAIFITFIAVYILVKEYSLGLAGMLYGYGVGFFAGIFFIIIVTKYWRLFSLKSFSLRGMKELVSYSYALIPNEISWWIINVSDRTIISVFLEPAANGVYAIANKVPSLCQAVFGVFNISWQEAAIEMTDHKERETYFNSVYNKTLAILLSLCIGILSANFLFFEYVFDLKYSEGRLYTPILISSVIFSILSQFYGGIQISLKNPKANGISTLIGAIVNVITHLVLINWIGLYAAAISTLVANIVVMIVRRFMLRKQFVFSLKGQQKIYVCVYLYFYVISLFELPIFVDAFHLVLAVFVFMFINKDLISNIFLKKILRK